MITHLPIDVQHDIQAIEQILLRHGAQEIILYGSMARDDYRDTSDIDICVVGLPNQYYFRALSECLMTIERPTSILDFGSTHGYLRQRIMDEGKTIAMSKQRLEEEVAFGLENLSKIYHNVILFSEQELPQNIMTAALTYECFGYYNAIEHLMIRFLKYFKVDLSAGRFSHRETIRAFQALLDQHAIKNAEPVIEIIENLMAFRHVATKIYSFLIEWDKLEFIIQDIQHTHGDIQRLFQQLLQQVE